jgi:hypothetical protein
LHKKGSPFGVRFREKLHYRPDIAYDLPEQMQETTDQTKDHYAA